MRLEEEELVFNTGKRYSVNRAIVGLCIGLGDEDGALRVYEGYDGGIAIPGDEDMYFDASKVLNESECVELAEFMIAKWAEFKAKYTTA